ncbi:MAG: O-antigen ligase family protein [Candidatus Aminicenantes bacterium]|nr:O-antigen ligase family protein [Candidatus Aminicenantes bacterium]MBM3310297.1 O-antigen ligase family protein [Candidatus Aminicenantes bacterium]
MTRNPHPWKPGLPSAGRTGAPSAETAEGLPLSPKDRRLRAFVEYGLLALLVWTPLPVASVHEWSILLIQLAAVALFGATLAMDRPSRMNGLRARRLRWLRYAVPALFAFLLFQFLPLPAFAVRLLSPRAAALREAYLPSEAPPVVTLSLLPGRTLSSALTLAAYALIGYVVFRTVTHRRQFRRVILVLVGLGVFEALYGLFELMRKDPRLLFYRKTISLDAATGTFVNRNHFAGYLEMVIPLALGLLLSRLDLFGDRRTWRERVARLVSRGAAVNILLGAGLVVMAVAVLRSNSRSGAVVLGFIFVLFFEFAAFHFGKKKLRNRRIRAVLVWVILGITASAFYFGVDAMVGRFALDKLLQDGRPQYWGAVLRMIADFPLTGVGLGAFGQVYQAYDAVAMPYALVHAHNDYFEFLSELGFIGFLLLAGIVFLIIGDAVLTWSRRRNPEVKSLALGGIVSLAALLVHSLTDFNLQVPANALVFVVVLAMTSSMVYHRMS